MPGLPGDPVLWSLQYAGAVFRIEKYRIVFLLYLRDRVGQQVDVGIGTRCRIDLAAGPFLVGLAAGTGSRRVILRPLFAGLLRVVDLFLIVRKCGGAARKIVDQAKFVADLLDGPAP